MGEGEQELVGGREGEMEKDLEEEEEEEEVLFECLCCWKPFLRMYGLCLLYQKCVYGTRKSYCVVQRVKSIVGTSVLYWKGIVNKKPV